MVFITQILILEYSLQEVVVVTNVDVFSQRFVARGNQSPRTANARVPGAVSGGLGVAQAAEQVVERALVAIDVHGGRHHGALATALDLAVARARYVSVGCAGMTTSVKLAPHLEASMTI